MSRVATPDAVAGTCAEDPCEGGGVRPAEDARALFLDTVHPAASAVLVCGVVLATMLVVQPVCVGLSLVGALACSLVVRGAAATLRGLRWQLPLLALVCLANPLFVGQGTTLLAQWGPVRVCAESLAYGATMGCLMVASVLWLECAARILTQDRLWDLSARSLPVTALVASMAAHLVPQLMRRSQTVRQTLAACTASGQTAPQGQAGRVAVSGVLLGWALEDSLERSDAMRARGWGAREMRTRYRRVRMGAGDVAALVVLVPLVALALALGLVAAGQWAFYPTMPHLVVWWGYVPYGLLMALPAVAELVGWLRWEVLR